MELLTQSGIALPEQAGRVSRRHPGHPGELLRTQATATSSLPGREYRLQFPSSDPGHMLLVLIMVGTFPSLCYPTLVVLCTFPWRARGRPVLGESELPLCWTWEELDEGPPVILVLEQEAWFSCCCDGCCNSWSLGVKPTIAQWSCCGLKSVWGHDISGNVTSSTGVMQINQTFWFKVIAFFLKGGRQWCQW